MPKPKAMFHARIINSRNWIVGTRLLRGDSRVLELGAAPGGWTTYIEERLRTGFLVAVDPLPITAGARTCVIEGQAGRPETDNQIDAVLRAAEDRGHFDLVLSDMAPNMSGVRAVDQARAMALADVALAASARWLRRNGCLMLKAFQGEGLDAWVDARKGEFKKVTLTKPKASRAESREVFVVAVGYAGRERDRHRIV